MELLQLEYFKAVVEAGGMTAAAEKLNVSQSTVSRCISRLETSLGFPLFDRSGRRIILNEYGKRYYNRVQKVFFELDDGQKEIREMAGIYSSRVSVSVPASRLISDVIMDFLADYPDVSLTEHKLTDIADIQRRLERGELDFAITYEPVDDPSFTWRHVLTERFLLSATHDHPLSRKTALTLSDLEGKKILLSLSDNHSFVLGACKRAGFTPRVMFAGNEDEILGKMIGMNLGFAIISSLSLYNIVRSVTHDPTSINMIPIIDPDFSRPLGLLSLNHHYMSTMATAFYRRTAAHLKTLRPIMDNFFDI